MNWKLNIIWIALALSAANMIACGQKKEENNGRPPLAPGVTPGRDIKNADSSTVSKLPIQVNDKLFEAQVSDIQFAKNSAEDDGTAKSISLKLTLNGQTKDLLIKQKSTDMQTADFKSGEYKISYSTSCTKECGKLYFVAKVTSLATGKDQSQLAVVKFLDGSLFYDDESQKSLANMGEDKIKSFEEMVKLLDQVSLPQDVSSKPKLDSKKSVKEPSKETETKNEKADEQKTKNETTADPKESKS